MDIDIKLHLQWYDEIQNCFREHTCFVFPKYEPMLLRIESWQAVSNTWRITMDNLCIIPSPLQIKYICHYIPIIYSIYLFKVYYNNLYILYITRSLVGCLRVDSYFSPSLVPQLQFSLSASSIKVIIFL